MKNDGMLMRAVVTALSGALVLSLATPVAAAPIPVMKSVDAPMSVEMVQYRGQRAPVRAKRRGNNGAAAAIIGAVAIGVAAIAASNAERRRQRRIESQYYYGGNPYGYGYAQPQPQYIQPQPHYVPVQPQYYGEGYYQQPVQPRWQQRRQHTVDAGSPYAVQHYNRRGGYGRSYYIQ